MHRERVGMPTLGSIRWLSVILAIYGRSERCVCVGYVPHRIDGEMETPLLVFLLAFANPL